MKSNEIVFFDPDGYKNFPYTAKVENLLGGVGCLVFPDGTVQFAENGTYPDIVYSPRMTESELEKFCEQNIERYQAYYEQHETALIDSEPVPPIDRFWE